MATTTFVSPRPSAIPTNPALGRFRRLGDLHNYYQVHDQKLGEGGFAKVRLATDLVTKEKVAIKCLDKIKLGPELPRIYNEIQCLKRLKHPNIARLYQVFETPTMIYLVLEYCSGGELFDYIVSKTRLTESESAQIIYDLMRVLDYIHINGFAHRDLKPENILFDDRHQIKLIDFGLAANCSDENRANNRNQAPIDRLSTCCGSVTYAAPEVISGSMYSGTAVDVWSAGVLLHALLVGQLPFNDQNIPKLYQKIQSGLASLPNYLSEASRDLIFKMLTVNPMQRITVRGVLAHPWLRVRTNRPLALRRLTPNTPERPKFAPQTPQKPPQSPRVAPRSPQLPKLPPQAIGTPGGGLNDHGRRKRLFAQLSRSAPVKKNGRLGLVAVQQAKTPKKSILKRILESATVKKSHFGRASAKPISKSPVKRRLLL